MHYPEDSELRGRHIERKVKRERIYDEATGEELTSEFSLDTAETFDGTIEGVEHVDLPLLACGHPHRIGEPVAVCSRCSHKAKRPVFVCGSCAVICPVQGEVLCQRHSVLGPDGNRYSPKGLRKAKRMGLFDMPPQGPVAFEVYIVPKLKEKQGILLRILSWW